MLTVGRLSRRCVLLVCFSSLLAFALAEGAHGEGNEAVESKPDKPSPAAAEYNEVLRILQANFADPGRVEGETMSEAALQGVLEQLGAGAMLLSQPSMRGGDYDPPLFEWLAEQKVGYVRLASFDLPVAKLRQVIAGWKAQGATGLIIDLRGFQASNGYAEAAGLLDEFVVDAGLLYTIQGLQIAQEMFEAKDSASLFEGPIVVVTNRQTQGAAEAFAAVLRSQCGAILVGRSTAGLAALYEEKRLSTGRYLRLASGRVVLPDGSSLFGKPVMPDVALTIKEGEEARALTLAREGKRSVAELVAEQAARQKLNEAALIARSNPEIDKAVQDSQTNDGPEPDEEAARDEALVRALDVIRAIVLTQQGARAAN